MWASSLVIMAVLAAGGAESERVGYATRFETDPLAEGWAWGKAVWEREARHPGEAEWEAEAMRFEVQKGMWRGPALPVVPLSYYAVRVVSRAEQAGYWGLLSYDADGNEIPASPYSNLDAAEDWLVSESAVLIPENAVNSRLLLWPSAGPIEVNETSIQPVSKDEALAIADALYARLPPVLPATGASRWQHLSRTRERLEGATPLTIVALGDSVANDMANANPQLLLERLWPGATVTLLNKVGSGTDAAGYLEGDRLLHDCLQFDPDLVIFGGMSTRSLADIRRLGAAVRATGAEFMALTSTLMIPQYWDHFEARQADRQAWLEGLLAAGEEDGFAVFDSGGEWDRYVTGSGLGIAYFRRDSHHGNELAKQVFARLLAAHLSP